MKKIAVIEGGYSNEKVVSIKSAKTVYDNLDRNKYNPTRVLIDKNEWTAYDDDGRYPIDKNDFSFIKNGDNPTRICPNLDPHCVPPASLISILLVKSTSVNTKND